jgi:hypothetical protein
MTTYHLQPEDFEEIHTFDNVEVLWSDSVSSGERWCELEEIAVDTHGIITVGMVIAITDTAIAVVSTRDPITTTFTQCMAIPLVTVTGLRKLT